MMLEGEFKAILDTPSNVKTFAIVLLGNFGPVARRPVADAIHCGRWTDS